MNVAQPSSVQVIDDTANGWIWSGMEPMDDSQLISGSGHAGGPGAYGAYTFHGTYLAVYTMRSPRIEVSERKHKTGRLRILIDNVEQEEVDLYSTATEYNVKSFEVANLTNGLHVLQVEPIGGWAMVDDIEVAKGDIGVGAPRPVDSSRPGFTDYACGLTYISSVPASGTYPDRGGTSLTNGVAADVREDPEWQGRADAGQYYQTVDLGNKHNVSELSCLFLQDEHYGILWPRQVEFLVSADGSSFSVLGLATAVQKTAAIRNYVLRTSGDLEYRYVTMRVVGAAWVFEDDLKVWGRSAR